VKRSSAMMTGAALMTVLFAGATLSLAQPSEPPRRGPGPAMGPGGGSGPGPSRPAGTEAEQRASAIAALEQRLAALREHEQAVEEGLSMLRAGEPLEKVREHAGAAFEGQRERIRERVRDGIERGPGDRRPMGPRGDEARPDGPGGPGGPGGHPPRLTPEQREAAMEFLRMQHPQMFERLENLRQSDPEGFDRMVEQRAPRVMPWLRERESDPEMFELRRSFFEMEMQARALAQQIAEATASSDAATVELVRTLGQQFDVRARMTEREISKLGERVQRLRQEALDQSDRKSELIQQRATEMIDRARSRPEGVGPAGEGLRDRGPDDRGPQGRGGREGGRGGRGMEGGPGRQRPVDAP